MLRASKGISTGVAAGHLRSTCETKEGQKVGPTEEGHRTYGAGHEGARADAAHDGVPRHGVAAGRGATGVD